MDTEEMKKAVWRELETVYDPEMGLNLVELGLIYSVDIVEQNRAKIDMTLTSMSCPIGPMLQTAVEGAARRVEGIEEVDVEIVWSPPWDPREMASEEVQMHLGLL